LKCALISASLTALDMESSPTIVAPAEVPESQKAALINLLPMTTRGA